MILDGSRVRLLRLFFLSLLKAPFVCRAFLSNKQMFDHPTALAAAGSGLQSERSLQTRKNVCSVVRGEIEVELLNLLLRQQTNNAVNLQRPVSCRCESLLNSNGEGEGVATIRLRLRCI